MKKCQLDCVKPVTNHFVEYHLALRSKHATCQLFNIAPFVKFLLKRDLHWHKYFDLIWIIKLAKVSPPPIHTGFRLPKMPICLCDAKSPRQTCQNPVVWSINMLVSFFKTKQKHRLLFDTNLNKNSNKAKSFFIEKLFSNNFCAHDYPSI